MSDRDALGMREFTPFQDGATWEDWRERVKAEYPIRYFISEDVGRWLAIRAKRVTERWYWLKCMTLPKYRYHKVDLRGVDPIGWYRYGYLSPGTVIQLACWKALRDYVERCKPEDPATQGYTEQDRSEPWYPKRKAAYDEAMVLYRYWMEDRKREQEAEHTIYLEKREAAKAQDKAKYEILSSKYRALSKAIEDREEEMLQRLLAIREYLLVP
jgi:hypothetical protein